MLCNDVSFIYKFCVIVYCMITFIYPFLLEGYLSGFLFVLLYCNLGISEHFYVFRPGTLVGSFFLEDTLVSISNMRK